MAHEVGQGRRNYYLQNIKYRGKDLQLATDWFQGTGPKEGFEKKLEILVTLPPGIVDELQKIEMMAIDGGLQIPEEFATHLSNADIFKRLPAIPNLYVKLHHEATYFDQNCMQKKAQDMGIGKYRAIIHVKAIYIGQHSSNKLAQLQLRVTQLQHIPQVVSCLFGPVPSGGLQESQAAGNQVPQQVVTAEPMTVEAPQNNVNAETMTPDAAQQTSKKGRKTKLQRQNAMVNDAVPQEFFTDENVMGNN